MIAITLLELYCAHFGAPPERATDHLFTACTDSWKRPFIALLRMLRPALFEQDLAVIAEAAKATDIRGVDSAIDLLQYGLRRERTFLRGILGLRVSGGLLRDLAEDLFERGDKPD
jgi:hypothetical protein